MREILFRGKRKDNGEWVEGFYTKGFRHEDAEELEDMIYMFLGDSGKWSFDYALVIPETVGQYTGLIDKNGTKIFEGDILKGSWETILTIFYDEISSSYRVKTSTGHEREPSYYGIDKWEIIGNIHDNPELMEEVQG